MKGYKLRLGVDHEEDNAGVIAPPPLIFALGILIGMAIDRVYPASFLPPYIQFVQGSGIGFAGLLICGVALVHFRKAKTSPMPHDADSALITTGLFRLSRNPIYVGMALIHLGVGLAVDSLWVPLMLLPVLLILRFGVISREESYLERKFGDAYLAYKGSVRRWI